MLIVGSGTCGYGWRIQSGWNSLDIERNLFVWSTHSMMLYTLFYSCCYLLL